MRILEAAGAAVICMAAGAAFSSALKARCRQLRGVMSLIGEMSAKIRYCAVPLPELIREISGESAYSDLGFLKRVNALTDKGDTVQQAWVTAARTAPFFSESDREVLTDIGARLGDTDTDGQLSMLTLAEGMLGRSLEEAEDECRKKAKALFGVWTLCGIGAGIVII